MTGFPVHVSDLSPSTTEHHLHDFFSFCGKINSIEFNAEKHSATINFEKNQAAKTALMLDGGTLDGAHISVTSESVRLDDDTKHEGEPHEGEFRQEDKPKAGIVAEYLAKGYKLSDHILHRAIDYDKKQGISTRFLSYIHSLDKTLGEKAIGPDKTISEKLQETLNQAQAQAKSIDEQQGLSSRAADYYSKALSSPFGQKVKQFYTTTSKQVLDVHEEALRIANLHPQKHAEGTPLSTGVGTSAPPADPNVRTAGAPTALGSAGAGITGGQDNNIPPEVVGKGKTTEAPTVF